MNIKRNLTTMGMAGVIAVLTGCATSSNTGQASADNLNALNLGLEERKAELDSRELVLQDRERALANISKSGVSDLLPPNAKSGECYARVWVPEQYRTVSEKMLATEASERIEVIPAKYEWVTETIEVSPASTRLVKTPAVYGAETEKVQVREEQLSWRLSLDKNAAPASEELLSLAKKYGANLDSATPGMCFHEHYVPATFETVTEQVLVAEPSESVTVIPASFRTVEKKVLVSEASSKVVQVPAVYKTEYSKVLVKPAHTVWKKGTGPIQRIDSATGEIMCLVEVPAVYKTVSKQVVVKPATVKTVEIPAVYKTIKVKELVSAATEKRTEIPAKYKTISKRKKVSDASVVWHEVHNKQHPTATRTGQQVCLVKEPAVFKTVSRKVVKVPAGTKEVKIPAKTKTVKVRKLVSPASERRIAIPATYKTVTRQELVKDGYMQWRSILCKTNMTANRIAQIQSALKSKGFNPGPIDGVVGEGTIRAINAFQKSKGLPVDRYLNVETIKALGVSVK